MQIRFDITRIQSIILKLSAFSPHYKEVFADRRVPMKRNVVLALGFALFSVASGAQTTSTPKAPDAAMPAAQETKPTTQDQAASNRKGFVLEDGTPVKLRINRTISSGDAHVGETVDFEVLEDVSIDNLLVIPKGGLAFATVTEAQAKRRMARGGKLDINIDFVRLVTSEKAALRAVKEVKGGGHTGAMTGGIVATSLVFFPAAPFFLFMHGKDTSIPKGTEITAYVNGDMKLDPGKFQAAQPVPNGAPSQPSGSVSSGANESKTGAEVEFSSTPSGADVEIDGNFMGSTPSTIGVTAGTHQIVVKKTGFKPWERKIGVSSGHIKIDATLEAQTN